MIDKKIQRREFLKLAAGASAGIALVEIVPVVPNTDYSLVSAQSLAVCESSRVTGGTFTMSFGSRITKPLAFDITQEELNSALEEADFPCVILMSKQPYNTV